jgi:hypothetical protein
MGMVPKDSSPRTFPHPYGQVFEALVAILPPEGFTIAWADKATGRISIKTGINMRTWGEELLIHAGAPDPASTQIVIHSELKFGLIDWGRQTSNFARIEEALGRYLAYYYPDNHQPGHPPAPPSIPPTSPITNQAGSQAAPPRGPAIPPAG